MDGLPGPLGQALKNGDRPEPAFGLTPVQFVDVRPGTPDGKVDLFPDALEAESSAGLYRFIADPASERYPLALISPASSRTISSSLGELPRPQPTLAIHPLDARPRGLIEGAMVRVFNELGEVHCPVSIEPTVRPGTVSLPKGLWRKSTANGFTGTVLVPDTLTDIAGGACFNDARVQVELLQ